jgi:hypothetical protein
MKTHEFFPAYILALLLLLGCQPEPQPPCSNRDCPPRARARVAENRCTCVCNPQVDFPLVDAGNAFCVWHGSYVAYLERRHRLDTFALWVPPYEDWAAFSGRGMAIFFRQQESLHSKTHHQWAYSRHPEGDSIHIDFYFPAPDLSFDIKASRDNEYSPYEFRLRFEGFRTHEAPDSLYAAIHYLTFADNPVRPPAEFVMVRVE